MDTAIKTLKVRVRDKHAKLLSKMAFEVNQVWNNANAYTAEYSSIPVPGVGYIRNNITAFDLAREQKEYAKERGLNLIHSQTVQAVTAEHHTRRKQFKKSKLRWRSSGGPRKSLGWVPFSGQSVKWVNGQFRYFGNYFKVWDTYGLSKYKFKAGSFSEDSRGRWYLNVVVEVPVEPSKGTTSVGVDLGLKTTATCSDGTTLENNRFYRGLEQKLAKAQRARKKRLVQTIHAKIKNRRKDAIHKFTDRLTKEHGCVIVGNVSSSKLAKTNMAKSVLDAGWFMLKEQLKYKAIARSVVFEEVDERYTTQTCSCCLKISDDSPKGRAGLEIRGWTCSECGTTHDRDINAAKNILRLGHQSLAGGIPFL